MQLHGWCPRDHPPAPWCGMVRAGAVREVSSQATPLKKASCTLVTGATPITYRRWHPGKLSSTISPTARCMTSCRHRAAKTPAGRVMVIYTVRPRCSQGRRVVQASRGAGAVARSVRRGHSKTTANWPCTYIHMRALVSHALRCLSVVKPYNKKLRELPKGTRPSGRGCGCDFQRSRTYMTRIPT